MVAIRYTGKRTGRDEMPVPGRGVVKRGDEIDVDDETALAYTRLQPTAEWKGEEQVHASDFELVDDTALGDLSKAELVARAEEIGVPSDGTKADIAARIAGHPSSGVFLGGSTGSEAEGIRVVAPGDPEPVPEPAPAPPAEPISGTGDTGSGEE